MRSSLFLGLFCVAKAVNRLQPRDNDFGALLGPEMAGLFIFLLVVFLLMDTVELVQRLKK